MVCDKAVLAQIEAAGSQIIAAADGTTRKVETICARKNYTIGTVGFLFYLRSRFGPNIFFFVAKDDCKKVHVRKEDGTHEVWPQFEPDTHQ